VTSELQPKPLEKPAPHRRGFRARAHAPNQPGQGAFSSRALAASLVLHVTLLGTVGLSSVLARSSSGGGREQSILFARSNEEPDATGTYLRPDQLPIDETSPELHELMRELWKTELTDAPPELDEPATPKFPAPEPSLDHYWAPALSELDEPLEPEPQTEQVTGEAVPELEPERPEVSDEPEPLLLRAPPPPYPSLASRMSWEGTVHCLIRVAPDGSVESVVVERSSGHAILDEAALEAIRTWRFEPRSDPGELHHKVTFRIAELPNQV